MRFTRSYVQPDGLPHGGGHRGDVLGLRIHRYLASRTQDEAAVHAHLDKFLAVFAHLVGLGHREHGCRDVALDALPSAQDVERATFRNPIRGFGEVKLDHALSVLREDATADVRHDALSLLAAYDEQHSANLVETLRTYLSCACSATAAAEALFVHRSTLPYRLDRIAEIGGVDLTDPDVRFHLELSLRL